VKKEITTELVRELLNYDQDTGLFTWRSRERHWFNSTRTYKMWNTRFAGKVAGCVVKDARGYPALVIGVFGKLRKAHRLAFIWMGEALPEQVDHLNRNSIDNRWENLVASSNEENSKNRSMKSNNTSGVTGVTWHKAIGKWQSQVSIGGKQKHLGYFTDPTEAAEVVKAFRLANGYSEGHGEQLAKYVEEA